MTKEERSEQRKRTYETFRSAIAFIRYWKPRTKLSRLRTQVVENYGHHYTNLLY